MTRLKEYKVTITYPYQSKPTKQVIVPGINPRDAEEIAENIYGGKARATSENRGKKMKTFREFNEEVQELLEAPTEAQAAKMAPGMSPEKRRAALERNARNQARRSTPETPKQRKALPPGKSGGALQRAAVAAAGSPAVRQAASALAKRTGSALVKSGKGALTTRGKVTPTDPKKTVMSGRGDEKRDVGIRTDMPKVREPEKRKGFMDGLKKSMGGDHFHKDPDIKSRARHSLGHRTGDKIKSAAGSAISKQVGGTMDAVSGQKSSGPKPKGGYN